MKRTLSTEEKEIPFTEYANYLTDKESSVAREAILKAVTEAAIYPKESADQFIAQSVKQDLEFELKGSWNCIVGAKFGLAVNVEDNKYAQLFVDERYNIFLFKNPSLKTGDLKSTN